MSDELKEWYEEHPEVYECEHFRTGCFCVHPSFTRTATCADAYCPKLDMPIGDGASEVS